MKNKQRPLLVAIVGGSGAGKSWLAEKLKTALGNRAMRLSLDDFYHDHSRLSTVRRAQINFDNPRAIDWPRVQTVLNDLLKGRSARLPCYDFKTHCRLKHEKSIRCKPIVLADGLWLLRRPALRRLFDLKIFIECPAPTRLKRRLKRDSILRGRTTASVREQFRCTVEPMHAKFVTSQKRWADLVLTADFDGSEIQKIAEAIISVISPKPVSKGRGGNAVARKVQTDTLPTQTQSKK
jgi:uridine kinase